MFSERVKNNIFLLCLCALTLLSALLFFHRLGDRSLCGDEMDLRHMAKQPVARIMRGWPVQAEPGAHLIKHFFLMISDSPASLRILGVTGAIAMVLLTGLLAGSLMGRWAGLTAASLVMFCPGIIKWGQYSRFYTFGTALMLLATLLFFRALERDTWKAWIWYGVVAFLQIQLWYFGMVHLAVCLGVYVVAWLAARFPFRHRLVYGRLNWWSLLKVGVVAVGIGSLLLLQYFTINDRILGVVLNPTDNDQLIRYGPSTFSWETFGFVFQQYLPAYVHMKWLLIVGFIAALVIDRERSFLFALISVGTVFIIVWGLDKNKATLSDNRMLFTVPFWAYFMARGAWLITDIFWRAGQWSAKKWPSVKQQLRCVQWAGTVVGVACAAYVLVPLECKAWRAFARYYEVDLTYCRNIGDFLAANVGANDSIYYEWRMEGQPIKYYYDKQRGSNPVMHVCAHLNKGGFTISPADIEKLKAGENRMWLLPNWRPEQNTIPRDLRQWLGKGSVTLAIEHPWVPWSGPQRIIIADKRYENLSPYERDMETIRWLKKFTAVGKYYNDAAITLLQLYQKNRLTNEFSRALRTALDRYPGEPKIARALEKLPLNDNDLHYAVARLPRSGAMQARLAAQHWQQGNKVEAACHYAAALKNSPTNIFDGPTLRELLKDKQNRRLRNYVRRNLDNKKTLHNLTGEELVAWAACAPRLLGMQELILPVPAEKRYLQIVLTGSVDAAYLKRRMARYPYRKLWECTEIANVFTHAKNFDLAVEWLALCIDNGAREWLLAKRLVDLYQARNKPEERARAIAACRNFKQWLPDDDLTNKCVAGYKLGMLYLAEDRQDESLLMFAETAGLSEKCGYHPLLFRAWIQQGHIARKRRQWDKAMAAYEKVLEFEPQHASTMAALADVYQQMGKTAEAAKLREKISAK